jgi:paraquat-inducible protein A
MFWPYVALASGLQISSIFMSDLIACHGCDLLVDVGELEHGTRAYCPRCSHFLTRYQRDAMSRVLAYTLAAIILLVLSLSFPFLSFGASGLESVMTLREAPGSLWQYGMHFLAFLVGAFIILIPALILLLLVAISVPKIAAMATVVLGISFWAYAAFSICFTLAMVTLDRYQCWEMIEALETPPDLEVAP